MSTFVKICGLKDERDVEAAIAAGADAIGFVFAESVRRVTPEQARDACAAVPPDVRRVAVMLHPANDEWREVLDVFAPDVLQTDVEDFESLEVPESVERWPVVRESRGGTPLPLWEGPLWEGPLWEGRPGPTATFVYEGGKSGAGETVDWERAAEVAEQGRMILAGGLHSGNVAQAIEQVGPFGVDVSSGVELAPGEKDPRLVQEFISAAKAVERKL